RRLLPGGEHRVRSSASRPGAGRVRGAPRGRPRQDALRPPPRAAGRVAAFARVELRRAEPGSIARRLALIVAAVTVLVTVLSPSALLAWSQRRYDESLHRRAEALLRY